VEGCAFASFYFIVNMQKITKKYFSRYKKPLAEMPNLVEMQKVSYDWLVKNGLKELFQEFSPIRDYSGKKFELEFVGFELSEPRFDEFHARENKVSLETPLRARVRLTNKTLGVVKEQEIFMADFPLVTDRGTFIINGVERAVVPQLARCRVIQLYR
jgi:DNA-directed RNA polymerase subunit beta